jgi:hypothetical protein
MNIIVSWRSTVIDRMVARKVQQSACSQEALLAGPSRLRCRSMYPT